MPQRMTDHGDRRCACFRTIARTEDPAEHRLHTQHRVVIDGDSLAGERLDASADADLVDVMSGQHRFCEEVAARRDFLEPRIIRRARMRVAAFARRGHVYEFPGIAHRQLPEQEHIEQAEDRRARADTERKRQDGGQREPGRTLQRAGREPQIAGEIVNESEPARLATGFLPANDVAEFLRSATFGIGTRHPLRLEIRGPRLQVKAHLALHLALHARAPKPRAQERAEVGHWSRHGAYRSPGADFSTSPIAPDNRSQ